MSNSPEKVQGGTLRRFEDLEGSSFDRATAGQRHIPIPNVTLQLTRSTEAYGVCEPKCPEKSHICSIVPRLGDQNCEATEL